MSTAEQSTADRPIEAAAACLDRGYTALESNLTHLIDSLRNNDSSDLEESLRIAQGTKIAMTAALAHLEQSNGDVSITVKKFVERFREHLKVWFEEKVLAPLENKSKPRISINIIREIEVLHRQLKTACCGGQLSILLSMEQEETREDLFVGHALEMGVVGQGNTFEEAIESAANLAEWQVEDMGEEDCVLQLPALPPDFETFDAVKSDAFNKEQWGPFSRVVSRKKPGC
ncbi:hypothetical protein KKF55_03750 [Patescibacteria group bacterium]|nr:hypothetical protein [Patescibacteria group bacterium]